MRHAGERLQYRAPALQLIRRVLVCSAGGAYSKGQGLLVSPVAATRSRRTSHVLRRGVDPIVQVGGNSTGEEQPEVLLTAGLRTQAIAMIYHRRSLPHVHRVSARAFHHDRISCNHTKYLGGITAETLALRLTIRCRWPLVSQPQ